MGGNNVPTVTSTYCARCQGKYWDDDTLIRLTTVKKAFDIIPNPCVGSMQKPAECPYRKKEEVKSDD